MTTTILIHLPNKLMRLDVTDKRSCTYVARWQKYCRRTQRFTVPRLREVCQIHNTICQARHGDTQRGGGGGCSRLNGYGRVNEPNVTQSGLADAPAFPVNIIVKSWMYVVPPHACNAHIAQCSVEAARPQLSSSFQVSRAGGIYVSEISMPI